MPASNHIKEGIGMTLALIANGSYSTAKNIRKFNLINNDDAQTLQEYLFEEPSPGLIIKIIGVNHEKMRKSFRASIQTSFKQVLRTLIEKTDIWLLNATRTMIDSDEYSENPIENNEKNPNIIICESLGKSQLLRYHPTKNQLIDDILNQIQQKTSSKIPLIALFVNGSNSSIDEIYYNVSQHIPTIIIKGSGSIANEIAALYEPNGYDYRSSRERVSDIDIHRLNQINDKDKKLILVCQPGKDELDEIILRAIGTTLRYGDKSLARINELNFAMKWNKIVYAEIHILNHNTILNWTNEELDTCLEMAILVNAVSFVELLFDFGASLQRLALTANPDVFKTKSDRRDDETTELIFDNLSVMGQIDPEEKFRTYFRQLFCWTIENQYFDLVMSLCTRIEDPIVGMLLVSQWCQYKEQNDYSISSNFRKHRPQFETYAADILDLYFEYDQEATIEYLDVKSAMYNNQQPSVLIDDLCSKELVSTGCMQSYMNKVWYGTEFHQNKNFVWEILICLVCICPLLLFIPFIRNRILQNNASDDVEQYETSFRSGLKHSFRSFYRFYQGNAVIRFRYTEATYTAFLIIFSYTILFDYFPLNIYQEKRSNIYRLPIPITEMIVHLFLISIAFEEIRQIVLHVRSVVDKSPYWKNLDEIDRSRNNVWSFFRTDPWNILDFIAFTLWIVGVITRFVVQDHAFEVSKICMSIDLCLWYMRCLHIFISSEKLGPRLLMIFHTMKDLMLFLFFIFIFLCAYTITTYSLITTSSYVIWSNATYFTTVQNGGNLTSVEIFRNIIEWGTWKIFGSTSLVTTDAVDAKYTVKNDAYGFVTLFLTITFLIIAYVLLLNNLIALFNFTIQRVHGESRRAWCYHFYVVLREYEEKDIFFPPFNLLLWPISYLINKKTKRQKKKKAFIGTDKYKKEKFHLYQQTIAEKYWRDKLMKQTEKANQGSRICMICRHRGTKADFMESTYF